MSPNKLIAFALFFFLSVAAFAQPGGGGNPGGGTPVPISGIEFLLLGGGALGIWRLVTKGKRHHQ